MNLPPDLYTAAQVRELDRIAIEDFSIPGFMLMQYAGQATFDALLEAFPDTRSLCVICATGNNGGDGYVIATLAIEAGFVVKLVQLGDSKTMTGDTQRMRAAFLLAGGQETDLQQALLCADVIVDAIFGTGLSRDISGSWADVIRAINASPAKVVAVDIPSGLHADTGRVQGIAVKADLTVTFIGLKRGLFTAQARDYCGEIRFNDLQVPPEVYQQLNEKPQTRLIPGDFIRQKLKPRQRSSHKGDHGHVLLIGGAQGMSGAIRLAAEAALRTGAGLVSVATAPSHAELLNLTHAEIMVKGVEDANALSPLINKSCVIGIGPGLGQSEWSRALLFKVLESDKALVLDADALNLLAQIPDLPKNKPWILTPHPAEAARLLGMTTQQIEADRYQSIQKLSKKGGDGFVLKGAGTLVSDGVTTHVCTAGNPGMASGGMGDVLSGIIAALVAQGLSLADAAIAGVELHAQAADRAAQQGERGLLASDLFPYLRELVNP